MLTYLFTWNVNHHPQVIRITKHSGRDANKIIKSFEHSTAIKLRINSVLMSSLWKSPTVSSCFKHTTLFHIFLRRRKKNQNRIFKTWKATNSAIDIIRIVLLRHRIFFWFFLYCHFPTDWPISFPTMAKRMKRNIAASGGSIA